MAGYQKYNGTDSRPKFSSSEKGRSREVHYVLGKIGSKVGRRRRKPDITFEDMNEVAALFLGLIILVFWGLYKIVAWLYKKNKMLIVHYKEKRKTPTITDELLKD